MKPAALWYFESINLFKSLCPVKLGASANTHIYLTFKKGEYVYLNTQPSDTIFFVSKGRVKIFYRNETNKEVIRAILATGEIFGELALADEKMHTDFAQAMDNETVVCCWKLNDIKQLMLENQELSFSLVKLVGLRLIKMERKLDLLVFKDIRTRVVEFLKDAAEWKGKKIGTETLIMTPLTQREIAKLIGVSRQSATTMLNQLRSENLIYFDRKRILIRNIDTLK